MANFRKWPLVLLSGPGVASPVVLTLKHESVKPRNIFWPGPSQRGSPLAGRTRQLGASYTHYPWCEVYARCGYTNPASNIYALSVGLFTRTCRQLYLGSGLLMPAGRKRLCTLFASIWDPARYAEDAAATYMAFSLHCACWYVGVCRMSFVRNLAGRSSEFAYLRRD